MPSVRSESPRVSDVGSDHGSTDALLPEQHLVAPLNATPQPNLGSKLRALFNIRQDRPTRPSLTTQTIDSKLSKDVRTRVKSGHSGDARTVLRQAPLMELVGLSKKGNSVFHHLGTTAGREAIGAKDGNAKETEDMARSLFTRLQEQNSADRARILNGRNEDGNTPLHMICKRYGESTGGTRSERVLRDIALEMVHLGADPSLTNQAGRTPSELSTHGGSGFVGTLRGGPAAKQEPIDLGARRSDRFSRPRQS